ncbi:MAG: polyprenyl synthetase family protein [Oleiphilaceae bacterium]|nr:polyprenyl synthetase family protein [Oleiphilaceae bacterium]
MTLDDFFRHSRERVDNALKACLPGAEPSGTTLQQAMNYAVLGGGKRIRPALLWAAASTFGGDEKAAMPAAVAVELIHAYSLVHDDLPAMDDDELRRGQPTCHVAFDEATAILAGDALQALAFQVLSQADVIPAASRLQMLALLSKAAGHDGMVGGQAMDLAATGQSTDAGHLERIHRYKTGALIEASVRMGALSAGISDRLALQAMGRYGTAIGLAFQVKDDILDVEGSTQVIGKPQGSDHHRSKLTYPALLGMDGARQRLAELHQEALESLQSCREETRLLREIADFVVQRHY